MEYWALVGGSVAIELVIQTHAISYAVGVVIHPRLTQNRSSAVRLFTVVALSVRFAEKKVLRSISVSERGRVWLQDQAWQSLYLSSTLFFSCTFSLTMYILLLL